MVLFVIVISTDLGTRELGAEGLKGGFESNSVGIVGIRLLILKEIMIGIPICILCLIPECRADRFKAYWKVFLLSVRRLVVKS